MVVAVIHRKNDNEDKPVVSKHPKKSTAKSRLEHLWCFRRDFLDIEIITIG